MHRNLLSTFVIDVPSDVYAQTAEFWTGALGGEVLSTRMANYTILKDVAPPNRVVVQDSGESPPRIHFDIHTDDLDAAIEHFQDLGATLVDDQWRDHPGQWVIMRDPAGMEFCVVWGLNELRGRKVLADFEARAREVGERTK